MKTIITLIAIAMLPFLVNAQNLVTNGGFENDLSDWTNKVNNGAVGTYSVGTAGSPEGSNHMVVQVDTLGAKPWDVQSMSTPFAVEIGKMYQVSVVAKSDNDTSVLVMVAQNINGADINEYKSSKKTLTTEWVTYTWEVTMEKVTDMQFKFQYTKQGTYYIDDVIFIEPVTIVKEDQTITFDAIGDKLTTDAPFDVTATASSGLEVTFSIISGPAQVSGTTITLDGTAGTVLVQADQAGDDSYNAAEPVQVSFEVTEPVTSIGDKTNNNVSVYPNPFNNQISIVSKERLNSVTIYNVTGQVVYSKTNLMNTKTVLGLNELNKGIYFLMATSFEGEVFIQKIIKE